MFKFLIAILGLLATFNVNAAQPQVEITTSMGRITLELYPDKAPQTVENFLQYVKAGFYDGTIFHRVIRDFMIQGGGFTPAFHHERTRAPIKNEAGNGLKNVLGTIAMARTDDGPHTATSQFFINVVDNPDLDFRAPTADGFGYCVFGKVVKGMDVVDKISRVATGPGRPPFQDVPLKPIVIEHARIIKSSSKSTK